MPRFTARQLAQMVGGRLVGPADASVQDVRALELAGAGDLAFLRTEARKDDARKCTAAVLVTPQELEHYAGTMIVCEDPGAAMATILAAFAEARFPAPEGISRLASVSPSAVLREGVAVADFAVIGEGSEIGAGAVIHSQVCIGRNCRVGERTILCAGVKVHDGCVIGSECLVQHNAVIGSEGFGFLQRDGRQLKVPQVGTVRIGDRVQIGALTTVDRATLEATVIEDGAKLDDNCHVAHNCHIGPDCVIAAGAMIGGSVRLGRGVILAGDVAVKDHVSVGDGAIVGAGSGVHRDVAPGEVVWGYPIRPLTEQRRIFALLGRVPEMVQKLRQVEQALDELRRRLDGQP